MTSDSIKSYVKLYVLYTPTILYVQIIVYIKSGLKPTKDYQFRVIPQVGTGYLAPTPSAALTMLPGKYKYIQ